jgi:hypothetical protein
MKLVELGLVLMFFKLILYLIMIRANLFISILNVLWLTIEFKPREFNDLITVSSKHPYLLFKQKSSYYHHQTIDIRAIVATMKSSKRYHLTFLNYVSQNLSY